MGRLTSVSCLVSIALCRALSTKGPLSVLVTGASGRTGQLVFEALLQEPGKFSPKALVRSQSSGKKLCKAVPQTDLSQVVVCDVTTLIEGESVPHALEDCKAMVICTSAVPSVSKLCLLKTILKIPFNLIRGRKAVDFRSLQFVWKNGQYPELVDYKGQIAQIDLAKRLKMEHVVVVSSMGGTDPSNFLNAVGKKPDGTGNGDILLWKRRAEKYLVDSGLSYTIIHPGGLTDTPGGKEDFVLDVNDTLMKRSKKSISRADVAALCLAALSVGKGKKSSLDCVTEAKDDGKVRSAEAALRGFLQQAKVYDYAL